LLNHSLLMRICKAASTLLSCQSNNKLHIPYLYEYLNTVTSERRTLALQEVYQYRVFQSITVTFNLTVHWR